MQRLIVAVTSLTPASTNLRTSHFLINLSPFGPNNQFRGFRDTILLSYLLNRTLILPLFFKLTLVKDNRVIRFLSQRDVPTHVEIRGRWAMPLVDRLRHWMDVLARAGGCVRSCGGLSAGRIIHVHTHGCMLHAPSYFTQVQQQHTYMHARRRT